MRILLILGLFSSMIFAPGGDQPAKPAAAPPIKVGLFVSTTGPIATFGLATKQGVELAVKEINENGGVDGQEIDLTFYDVCSKPEEARVVAEKLVDDQVKVAIGAVASACSMMAAPVFDDAGIPMITPCSTNPKVTQLGDMIFRACFIDKFQARALAHYAHKDLEAKKVAILSCQDDVYSLGLAETFKAAITDAGAEVVAEEKFASGTVDFSTHAKRINDSEADVLFAPIYYSDLLFISAGLKDLESDIQLLGGDGWESQQLLRENAGLEGAVFGTHFTAGASDAASAFAEAYESEYDEKPDSLAALGYDTVKLVAKAIVDGGSAEGKKLRDALAQIDDFDGITGENQQMGEDRNMRKPLVIVKIEDGQFHHVRHVTSGEWEEEADTD